MNTSLQGAKIMIDMELCENGYLLHCIHSRLPWPLKVRLILDVAIGLAFLHEHGIIHRDIKTTNVLVDASWRARLCDFSFAIHSSSLAKREFTYGTDEFMSPEIALALDFDTPTDIFSFGIMLCELITEKEPSKDFMNRTPNTHFALYEDEVKAAIVPGCPEALEALALNCCDFEPSKRPSAMTCVDELQSLFADLGGDDVTNNLLPGIFTPHFLSLSSPILTLFPSFCYFVYQTRPSQREELTLCPGQTQFMN